MKNVNWGSVGTCLLSIFFATQGGVLTDYVNISYVNLFFPIIYFQSKPY